jgi:hypothetical protein
MIELTQYGRFVQRRDPEPSFPELVSAVLIGKEGVGESRGERREESRGKREVEEWDREGQDEKSNVTNNIVKSVRTCWTYDTTKAHPLLSASLSADSLANTSISAAFNLEFKGLRTTWFVSADPGPKIGSKFHVFLSLPPPFPFPFLFLLLSFSRFWNLIWITG